MTRKTVLDESAVLQLLHSMQRDTAVKPVQSCRISAPQRHPFGRSYRLVEWTLPDDEDARRQVVPAESSALDIARVVASHIPGRRVLQNGEA
ncbi:DUF2866 domain-containing protein [Paraburkholderia kururiensis]